MRPQFCFRAEYYDAVKHLPKREQTAVLLAICSYALEDTEPELTGLGSAVFELARPFIDADNEERDSEEARKLRSRITSQRYRDRLRDATGDMSGDTFGDNLPPFPPLNPPITPPKEKPPKGGKKKGFTPPSLEDVTAYCKERENDVDPQRFVDFYTAKGWLVGKTKMKDWKAAVRTWERMNSSFGDNRGEAPKGKEEVPPAPRHTFVRTGEWEGYWVDENGERIE